MIGFPPINVELSICDNPKHYKNRRSPYASIKNNEHH
jgi:hypothetical protein